MKYNLEYDEFLKNKKLIRKIIEILDREYPNSKCDLKYSNGIQLLVAVQLSPRTTDNLVNKVTENMFKDLKSVHDFAIIPIEKLEDYIKPTGFFRNKAENISNASKMIRNKYKSVVPDNLKDLISLPGIGRKIANVVLGNLYNQPTIAVDTHVFRVCSRIFFNQILPPSNKSLNQMEYFLLKHVPIESQVKFCHQIIKHGRKLCNKNPKCTICHLKKYCNLSNTTFNRPTKFFE